jgi:hypothetical protein
MIEGLQRPVRPYLDTRRQDPGVRHLIHGPVLPMEEIEERGFLARFFWRSAHH